MKNDYIEAVIYGLPRPLRKGANTSTNSKRIDKEYIHKHTNEKGFIYWRVLVKRQDVYKCKYFKTFKEAKLFRDMLKINRYL